MKMRHMIFAAVFLAMSLLLAGCLNPPNNIPPGYEVKDYCQKDSDCVRLNSCCDCGLGLYVNTYNQNETECTGPRCMCAIANSYGKCQSNKCVAIANTTGQGFCGTSTYGACDSNIDCIRGGCSSQVCQSNNESQVITTCEYKDCYNADAYGAGCGCVNKKCQWVDANQQADKKFCNADSDCICMGIDSETGSCYLGNKDYYEKSVLNKTYICPDFCTGIAGNFEIKCEQNKCAQVKKLQN